MLTAILEGKKRGTGLAGSRLLIGETVGAEDILTATVFERLAYLPNEAFSTLMDYTLAQLDYSFGPLAEIEFWPSWQFQGTRVEPDVIIRNDECTLIVEAKRYDNIEQQYADQLAREIGAGLERGEISGNCILLTIGGLTEYSVTKANHLKIAVKYELEKMGLSDFDFDLVSISWNQLYRNLESAITEHQEYGHGLQRLCNDVAEAYSWHGLRAHPPLWLGELETRGIECTAFSYWTWKPIQDDVTRPPDTRPSLNNTLTNLADIQIGTLPGSLTFLEKSA